MISNSINYHLSIINYKQRGKKNNISPSKEAHFYRHYKRKLPEP
jgi:hypothetical protein